MTLQRRLILSILVAAPFAWLLTLGIGYMRAEREINELYDTDMVRMAEQIYALFPMLGGKETQIRPPAWALPKGSQGQAELGDIAVSAWLPDGRPLHVDPDGDRLPKNAGIEGFSNTVINGMDWRVYYIEDSSGGWRVGVGQRLGERDELAFSYIAGQTLPLLIGLPILLVLLIWGIRHALRPVRELSSLIERRSPDDPAPLNPASTPSELLPLVHAMNRLLGRVSSALEHERRLTADAAHELRTPLAALRSQWDVAQRAADPAERTRANANVEIGIDRLNRLVSQLLAMARLENTTQAAFSDDVAWPSVVEQALSDCLALVQRKDFEVETLWPPAGTAPLPLTGDEHLLCLMLRNLLDNAIRYSAAGGSVTMHFSHDSIVIDDMGPGVTPDQLQRLGNRFFRVPGQQEQGSGLGLSIAQRVAKIHGLVIVTGNRLRNGAIVGFSVTIRRESTPSTN